MPRFLVPSALEEEILGVVLIELRRAMKDRRQLSITIDPFSCSTGAHVFAARTEAGHTYTIDEEDLEPKKPTKRGRRGR